MLPKKTQDKTQLYPIQTILFLLSCSDSLSIETRTLEEVVIKNSSEKEEKAGTHTLKKISFVVKIEMMEDQLEKLPSSGRYNVHC